MANKSQRSFPHPLPFTALLDINPQIFSDPPIMSQRPNANRNPPSGLVNAVLETGRQRGDAATPRPAMATPSPSRNPQHQLPRMNSGNVGRPEFSRHPNNSQTSFRPGGALSKQPSFNHQSNMSTSSVRTPESENRRPGGNSRPGYSSHQNASQSSIHADSPRNQRALVRHGRNDSVATHESGQSSQSHSSGDAGAALAIRPSYNPQLSQGQGPRSMTSRRVR